MPSATVRKGEEVEEVEWPISSINPVHNDYNDIAALAPGKILQSCSGEDIYLSKNSDTQPNFTIGRGRFLLVLPGLLSLRSNSVTPTASSSKENKDSQEEKKQTQPKTKTATTKEPSTTTQMFGTIKNLDTTNPSFNIPLPNGRMLTLQGRKVKCSSQFLVLTCTGNSNAKKKSEINKITTTSKKE